MKNNYSQSVLGLIRASALFDEQFTGALSAVHGVSLREVMLLRYVKHAAGSKLSRVDLARRLYVSPSTVTRVTNPLEKIGLIKRESDARDARLSYVMLTAAGEKLLGYAEKTLEQLSTDYLSQRISEADTSRIESLVEKLTAGSPGGNK